MSNTSMLDARAPRFAAWITTFVLAGVLLSQSGWLLLAQAAVFALGVKGLSPYGQIFKRAIRPRLKPPTEVEPEAPTRFAQAVGFAVVGTIGFLAGFTTLGVIATAAALAAAFLNAAFGYCLGCEIYLLVKRFTNEGATA